MLWTFQTLIPTTALLQFVGNLTTTSQLLNQLSLSIQQKRVLAIINCDYVG